MKHLKYLSLAAGLMLMASSCTTIKKTATTAEVDNTVVTYPTVADLEVKGKTSKTMTWSFSPCHIAEPKLSTAKGNLIAELLEEQKADVLLEAQFSFQRTPYGERVLTVTGFPAVYKNFRKATKGDLDAIKAIPANEKTAYNKGGGLLGVFGK